MISDVVSWAIQSNNLDDVASKLKLLFEQTLLRVPYSYTQSTASTQKLLMLEFFSEIVKSIVLEFDFKLLAL